MALMIDPLTTACEKEWLSWMYGYRSDIVAVGLKLVHPLQGVVVVTSYVHIILKVEKRKFIADLIVHCICSGST